MTRRASVLFVTAALILSLATPVATAHGNHHGGHRLYEPGVALDLIGEIKGAPYEIRFPADWNGTLVLYAHGYRDAFDHPLDTTDRSIPENNVADSAPGGDAFEDALLAQGYALAGSLYASDGWAVRDGIGDTRRLVRYVQTKVAKPDTTIQWGFSMGSVVTMEMAEHNRAVDGFIAACAVGAGATDAWNVLLTLTLAYDAALGWPTEWGTPTDVPEFLDFEEFVFPVLLGQVSDPANLPLFEFVRLVSDLPPGTFYTNWLFTDMYFATEARAELERRAGGPVTSNPKHVYAVEPDEAAYLASLGVDVDGLLAEMNSTHTVAAKQQRQYLRRNADYTGRLRAPMLTLHTTIDGLVPVVHESAYRETVEAAGYEDLLYQTYVLADGHCAFSPEQLVTVIVAMEAWLDTGVMPVAAQFPDALGFDPDFEPGPWPQPRRGKSYGMSG